MVRFGLKSWSQKQTYFFLGSRIFSMVNHSSRLWFGTKNCVDYGAVLFFSSSPRCFPGITKTITISLSLRDVIKEWPLPLTQRIHCIPEQHELPAWQDQLPILPAKMLSHHQSDFRFRYDLDSHFRCLDLCNRFLVPGPDILPSKPARCNRQLFRLVVGLKGVVEGV